MNPHAPVTDYLLLLLLIIIIGLFIIPYKSYILLLCSVRCSGAMKNRYSPNCSNIQRWL